MSNMRGGFCTAEREYAAEAVPTQVRRSRIYKARADIVRLKFWQVQVVYVWWRVKVPWGR
jgi:hypothetical protein